MSNRKRLFLIFYWAALLGVAIYLCYLNKSLEFNESNITEGTVIGYVTTTRAVNRNSKKRITVKKPELEFEANGQKFLFTAYDSVLDSGEKATVLYNSSFPYNAQHYSIWYWIDFAVIIPVLLVGGFIFFIIWIKLTHYTNRPVILKGEFDPEE